MFSPRTYFGNTFAADSLTRRVSPVPLPPSTLGIFALRSFNAGSFGARSLDHGFAAGGSGGGDGGTGTAPPAVSGAWSRVGRQSQTWTRKARSGHGWTVKPPDIQAWRDYRTNVYVIPIIAAGDIDGVTTLTGVAYSMHASGMLWGAEAIVWGQEHHITWGS